MQILQVRTYNLTAFSGTAAETDTSGGITDTVSGTLTGSDFNNTTVTFTANGTASSAGSFTITYTYVENGTTFTDSETTDLGIIGAYNITGNSIFIGTSASENVSITISDFTTQGPKLNVVERQIGVDYTYNASATYTLVRR
jgi:hypothetical protein